MTDETEKLRRFKDAVFAEADEKVNKILADAQAQKDEILKKAELNAEAYKQEEIAKIDREENSRLIRGVSSAKLESQRNILTHREEVADRVFENVRRRVEQFSAGPGYTDWLKKAAAAAAGKYPDRRATVYLRGSDEKLSDEIKSATGFDVKTSGAIRLGGAMIRFEGINAELDLTFDSAVERERQDFCRNSQTAASE